MNSLVATPFVVPMLLGIKWLDPEWLQHEYGSTFIWIALAIVFVECGLFFPFLPGDTLLFALGLFIAGSNTTGYSVIGISNEPVESGDRDRAADDRRLRRKRRGLRDRAQSSVRRSTSARAGSSRRSTSTTPAPSSTGTATRPS
ncbi:hypothetical protein [Nocardioides convexus]|uniref:hypothetical protein n=1 Tax=Nocardioides convexus TaxID=2712224 RepID=UPI0024186367|nr:hypothetical protein [Nocardioides convexus]